MIKPTKNAFFPIINILVLCVVKNDKFTPANAAELKENNNVVAKKTDLSQRASFEKKLKPAIGRPPQINN